MVQGLQNQDTSEDSVSRKSIPRYSLYTIFAGDYFLALLALESHCCMSTCFKLFYHFRDKSNCYYIAKMPSKVLLLCKSTSCPLLSPPPPAIHTKPLMENGTFILSKRTRFLNQTTMGFCTVHRRIRV